MQSICEFVMRGSGVRILFAAPKNSIKIKYIRAMALWHDIFTVATLVPAKCVGLDSSPLSVPTMCGRRFGVEIKRMDARSRIGALRTRSSAASTPDGRLLRRAIFMTRHAVLCHSLVQRCLILSSMHAISSGLVIIAGVVRPRCAQSRPIPRAASE
jgi:hypothetical protein